MRRLLAAALMLIAAAQASATTFASDGKTCAKGRVLVGVARGVDVARAAGGKARALGAGNHVVEVPAGTEQAAVARLRGRFKFAELDCLSAPAFTPNDPYFGSAWHLSKIGAPAAWDLSVGAGVVIAILDTGVDATHADLSARMVPGWNFYDNNSNTSDVHGHGTGVAGAAAATLNNGVGVASVAGGARIMPVRIADANAWAYWSTTAQALTWVADQGVRVANISYVGVAGSSSVRSAAQYMQGKGGLVVVAAGNNNRDEGISPTTTMIPVSATDSADLKASFSSWGDFVAMSAPGVSIWTTVRGGNYQTWQGTSLASPVTAAVVALMMAVNPALSGAEVEQLLYASAVDLGEPGRDAVFGHGRVDAAAAVYAALGMLPPEPPPPPPPSGDTTPPTVNIVAPSWANVSGTVKVYATSNDNKGIAGLSMTLQIDGVLVASSTGTGKLSFSWNTRTYALGPHTITVTATDAAGNTASVSKAVNKPY
jgi:thermitase